MSKAPSSEGEREGGGPSRVRRALRRLAVIVAVLALLLAAAWARVRTFPAPDFPRVARPAGPAERAVPLPVLLVPQSDNEGGNGLVCIFVSRRGPALTEITLVFTDEDQPTLGLLDLAYDVYRSWKYGRIMDVETIYYRHAPSAVDDGDLRPREIDLGTTFARDQPFDVAIARHYEASFPRERFDELFGRPVLRVSTWNHMFTPGEPGEPSAGRVGRGSPPPGQEAPARREGLAVVSEAPVYEGTRAAVEALFAAAREGPR